MRVFLDDQVLWDSISNATCKQIPTEFSYAPFHSVNRASYAGPLPALLVTNPLALVLDRTAITMMLIFWSPDFVSIIYDAQYHTLRGSITYMGFTYQVTDFLQVLHLLCKRTLHRHCQFHLLFHLSHAVLLFTLHRIIMHCINLPQLLAVKGVATTGFYAYHWLDNDIVHSMVSFMDDNIPGRYWTMSFLRCWSTVVK